MSLRDLAFLLFAPTVGIIVGYARGGRLRNLANIRIRSWWMLWVAAVLQVVLTCGGPVFEAFAGWLPTTPLIVVFGIVVVWLIRNARSVSGGARVAMVLIAIGLVMNIAPIIANERMPFSMESALSAGITETDIADREASIKNEPADDQTRLYWLGDVIPVRHIRKVISLGDVAIMAGIAWLISAGMVLAPSSTSRSADTNESSSGSTVSSGPAE